MSEGLNTVTLLGNLGADAEYRVGASGAGVLKLRLATSEYWFDKDTNERKDKVEWHSVVVFGKKAEALAKLALAKGTRVAVVGSLHTSGYEKNGEKRFSTEVVAREVILNGKSGGAAMPAAPTDGQQYPAGWDDDQPGV